jgi:hypothetical protein
MDSDTTPGGRALRALRDELSSSAAPGPARTVGHDPFGLVGLADQTEVVHLLTSREAWARATLPMSPLLGCYEAADDERLVERLVLTAPSGAPSELVRRCAALVKNPSVAIRTGLASLSSSARETLARAVDACAGSGDLGEETDAAIVAVALGLPSGETLMRARVSDPFTLDPVWRAMSNTHETVAVGHCRVTLGPSWTKHEQATAEATAGDAPWEAVPILLRPMVLDRWRAEGFAPRALLADAPPSVLHAAAWGCTASSLTMPPGARVEMLGEAWSAAFLGALPSGVPSTHPTRFGPIAAVRHRWRCLSARWELAKSEPAAHSAALNLIDLFAFRAHADAPVLQRLLASAGREGRFEGSCAGTLARCFDPLAIGPALSIESWVGTIASGPARAVLSDGSTVHVATAVLNLFDDVLVGGYVDLTDEHVAWSLELTGLLVEDVLVPVRWMYVEFGFRHWFEPSRESQSTDSRRRASPAIGGPLSVAGATDNRSISGQHERSPEKHGRPLPAPRSVGRPG